MRFLRWLLLLLVAAPAAHADWQSVGNMQGGGLSPAAVSIRLPNIELPNDDGTRILVAGGFDGNTTLQTAELFNPANNSIVVTGSLVVSRNFFTMTLLNEGQVLVAGGYNSSSGTLRSAEIYDPNGVTEIKDPITQEVVYTLPGKSTPLPAQMKARRELFTATKLPDGKVLLAGGFATFGIGLVGGTQKTADIYDPATGTFTATGSMTDTGTRYGRFGHAAIALPGTNKVLIVGGKERRSNADWRSLRSVEVYDQLKGTFTYVGDMAYRRDRPALAWIKSAGKVLIVGGKTEANYLGEAQGDAVESEWFDPASLTNRRIRSLTRGPFLQQGRMAHSLTQLSPDSFLVAGGWNVGQKRALESAETFVFDAAGGHFTSAGQNFMADFRHDHAAARLPDGRVIVLGGKKVNENDGSRITAFLKRFEIYAP